MMHPAILQSVGPMELIIILTIALLVFGSRLPEVGRSLGRGITEFRKGVKGVEDEVKRSVEETETPPYSPAPAPPRLPGTDDRR